MHLIFYFEYVFFLWSAIRKQNNQQTTTPFSTVQPLQSLLSLSSSTRCLLFFLFHVCLAAARTLHRPNQPLHLTVRSRIRAGWRRSLAPTSRIRMRTSSRVSCHTSRTLMCDRTVCRRLPYGRTRPADARLGEGYTEIVLLGEISWRVFCGLSTRHTP